LWLSKTHKKAMASAAKEWKKEEEEKLRSMRVTHVLKPAKLPDGFVPLNNKWVYIVKADVDGTMIKYKARLVA